MGRHDAKRGEAGSLPSGEPLVGPGSPSAPETPAPKDGEASDGIASPWS